MVIQARTRESLRVIIGYILMGQKFWTGTTDGAGSTTTLVDSTDLATGGLDNKNGYWVVMTSGDADGENRLVSDDNGSGTLTFSTAFSTGTDSGNTYELWWPDFPPEMIYNFMDLSMMQATGRAFDRVEDTSLCGDGKQIMFTIPSALQKIQKIQRRSFIPSQQLHDCDRLFDESTDSDITQSLTSDFKKQGSSALGLSIAAAAAGGEFVSDVITAIDVTQYTHIEGWIWPEAATSAGTFLIRLDESAGGGSPIVLSSIAAAAAGVWTHFQSSIFTDIGADEASFDAIVSLGIEYDVDTFSGTQRQVYFDDLRVTNQERARWIDIPRRLWRVNRASQELEFLRGFVPPQRQVLKLIGGSQPDLLTTDATVTDVTGDYVVHNTAGLALQRIDPAAAAFQFALALKAEKKFPRLSGGRATE